jgi:hypothetical protein
MPVGGEDDKRVASDVMSFGGETRV